MKLAALVLLFSGGLFAQLGVVRVRASIAGAGGPSVCQITTSSLPNGNANAPYSQPLQSANCTAPLTWSLTAGGLPSGLVLGSSSGMISGIPASSGTSSFTVHLVDAATSNANRALSITIGGAVPPITSGAVTGVIAISGRVTR